MNDLLYKVQSRFLFHAHIRIKIPASCDDAVFSELFTVMESVDRKYNSYSPDSYIDRINRNAGHFVTVDDEMASILKEIVFFSDIFKGAYDVTVMPLVRLWGFYRDKVDRIPSERDIGTVRPFVDYRKIEINGNEVRIGKGQEIVTGSFIKAYAVDRVVCRMRELGIDDGIINAGGSTIYALGPAAGDEWDIAVSDPADNRSAYSFSLLNRCLSTSCQSETFVTVDGKRYGHILDPRTGYPSPNRLVCIASDRCMVGDIVSTGLFCETRDSFTEVLGKISREYALEGFLIDPSGEPVCSSGFCYTHEKNAV